MANSKQKLSKMIAEGFGPVYEKGKILPKYRNLGPVYEKDIKMKVMKEKIKPKQKPKVWPNIKNIKHLA